MNSIPYISETLDPLVARVMTIDSITEGDPKQNLIVRYTGCIKREDTAAAYDELSAALKPLKITPLFRWEEDRHAVVLVPALPEKRPGNPLVNVILLILTFLSVLLTGAAFSSNGAILAGQGSGLGTFLRALLSGWPFAVSMLGILLAHEFGHYLAGRYHHTNVSLPYFIPFPGSAFGTMGAFINMKEPPKNRRILLDIGIAGPLAGLIVAIPVLILGLSLSHVETIPLSIPAGGGIQLEGNSLLYLISKFAVFGQLLPAPPNYGSAGPLVYWLRYFFTGQPLPLGGMDVILHPVAWAGWAGILVTALNLIPAGQLDGGHMLYVLVGKERARRILPFVLVGIVVLGFFWNVWWLWAALIFFLGRFYAEPLDQITPLDSRRKSLAVLALLIFIVVFTPVPLIQILG